VVKVRELLKTPPPCAPRNVSKGRFSFEASGEVLYVRKADKGKKDRWMRESRSRRSDRYADYKRLISRLGHSGNNRVLRHNFGACVQPLMAIEKVLTTVPMGGSARKDLVQARRVLGFTSWKSRGRLIPRWRLSWRPRGQRATRGTWPQL
jgi:hypothetical protein